MQNPADPYMQDREIVPACVHLRTKTMFYVPDEMRAGPGFIKVTDTGAYWCGKTHHALGPDDQVSQPKTCQPGRSCYERNADG
jgi:hypothetical protein